MRRIFLNIIENGKTETVHSRVEEVQEVSHATSCTHTHTTQGL